MSNLAEQQTEWIISNILINNNWIIDNKPEKNVYFQKPREEDVEKLKGKKPDYILYKNTKAIGVIEAKKGGQTLDKALIQATQYAELLNAPLIFASNNGIYAEARYLSNNKPLFINGERVEKIIKYDEAIKFIEEQSNEIYTVPPELIKSKEDLIKIFKNVNNLLRKANIFSGYDRINEFSTILFLKLISEANNAKSYWNSIKKQDDDFLFSYLNSTVIKELETQYNGGVFSEINIKKPSLIRQIMDMIDPLVLSTINSDIKGDGFEYFLKNMNQADNDLGQYFTPRHIVNAMVHLVNPKLKETIYDPFCGTGGFLIESFNHIKEHSIIQNDEDKNILTQQTLYGRDATKVSTIAKKNMILHGDGHSNIQELDSLENPVDGKHNCIITNIPFSLKDVDYTNLYYNGLGRKNGDAICVLHCLKALKIGGRMAVIVPEGFLFKKELKEVRKFLLSQVNLELVVSLPQGVFQPYTGVKTDILYFTNAHKPIKNKEGYYYFEVKNDGFTLDAHRRKIEGQNDIHKLEANNVLKNEKSLLLSQGFEFIPFSKIEQNDYNLVGTRYREIAKHNGKWEMVNLGDVAKIESGNSAPQEPSLFENGIYPFFRVSDVAKEHLSNNLIHTMDKLNPNGTRGLKLFTKHSILFPKSGASTLLNHRAIMGCDGYVSSHLAIIQANITLIDYRYLYYILTHIDAQNIILNDGYPSIRIQDLQELHIPLPPLDEQERIVKELDAIQNSIKSAEDLIKNLKSAGGGSFLHYGSDEFEMVRLGEVCIEIKNGVNVQQDKFNGKYRVSRIESISNGRFDIDKTNYTNDEVKEGDFLQCGDILFSHINSFKHLAKTAIYLGQRHKIVHGINLLKFRPNISIVLSKYLSYIMKSEYFVGKAKELGQRAVNQASIRLSELKELQIPLPPINIQQEIVAKLDEEQEYIKQTQNFIAKQKQKIISIVSRLWS